MCYEDAARPPFPPIRGGADSYGDIVLVSADGTECNAYFAHPELPSTKAIVILPDFRGLTDFYKELAVRFAEAGLHAVTIDYYTRTIGRTSPLRNNVDREFWSQQLAAMNSDDVDLEVAAATKWLRELPGAQIDSISILGFCCGGSFACNQAGLADHLNSYISVYGVPSLCSDARIATMRGPLLMVIAGKDFTPVEAAEGLAAKVRENGGPVETALFPEAPHGFFQSSRKFEKECDDSWHLMLDFLDRYAT